MRLSDLEITAIQEASAQTFGSAATSVWLFGSRVNETKRGGDIDLLVITETDQSRHEILRKETDFLVALKKIIGEQKVDLIVATPQGLATDPFLRTLSTRIPLTGIHVVKVTEEVIETAHLFLISLGETKHSESLDDYLVYSDGQIVALVQTSESGHGGGDTCTTAQSQTIVSTAQSTLASPIKRILTKKPEQAEHFKSLVVAELGKRRTHQ